MDELQLASLAALSRAVAQWVDESVNVPRETWEAAMDPKQYRWTVVWRQLGVGPLCFTSETSSDVLGKAMQQTAVETKFLLVEDRDGALYMIRLEEVGHIRVHELKP